MKIIYVDDEKSSRMNFHYDTKDIKAINSVEYFESGSEAIKYCEQNQVNAAFLDIDLRDMTGIELAKKLKEINKKTEVVFITGHEGFALQAYRNGGRAYLVKPYMPQELEETFELLQKITKSTESEIHTNEDMQGRVKIRTFGRFDLYIDNSPVVFKTAKSKELFAFLVDNKGASVTNAEIFTALWEDKLYTKSTSSYVRKTIAMLKEKLQELNIIELVNFERNALSINMRQFNNDFAKCDYYSIMNEEITHLREYNGYYMLQYAWAEESISVIEAKIKYLNKISLINNWC